MSDRKQILVRMCEPGEGIAPFPATLIDRRSDVSLVEFPPINRAAIPDEDSDAPETPEERRAFEALRFDAEGRHWVMNDRISEVSDG